MNKLVVEFLGTFALTAVVLFSKGNWILIGLMLGIDVLLGGKISGGSFNPAVTLSYCMTNFAGVTYSQFLPYLIAEFLGGILAALLFVKLKKR
jgi:glycerol uptake facilitator-like aquaporin